MTLYQAFKDGDVKNNNLPRMIACIYLHLAPNMPNGHNPMDLYTRRLIKRPGFMIMKCKMTNNAIY